MHKKQDWRLITIFIVILISLSGVLTFGLYQNQAKILNQSSNLKPINTNPEQKTAGVPNATNLKLPWLFTSLNSVDSAQANQGKFSPLEILAKKTTIRDQSGQKIENPNLTNAKDVGIFENQAVIQNNDDSVIIWNLGDDSTQKISRLELTPKNSKIDQKYLFFRNFKLSAGKLYYEVLEDFAIVDDLSTLENPSDYDPCQNKQCSIVEFDLNTGLIKTISENLAYFRYDGNYRPSLFAVDKNQIITLEGDGGGYAFKNTFQFTDIDSFKASKTIDIVYTGKEDTFINLGDDALELDNLSNSKTPYKCIGVEPDKINPTSAAELQKCRQDLIVKLGTVDTLNSDIKKYLIDDIKLRLANTALKTQLSLENPGAAMGFNSPDLSKELVCGDYQTGINLPNSKNDGQIYISYKGQILPEYPMISGELKCLDNSKQTS